LLTEPEVPYLVGCPPAVGVGEPTGIDTLSDPPRVAIEAGQPATDQLRHILRVLVVLGEYGLSLHRKCAANRCRARHDEVVRLEDAPVVDVRPLLIEERRDLVELLGGLSAQDWTAPTEAGHWRVKDAAIHLLDDDLGWLSRWRDNDLSGLLSGFDDYRSFVAALDAKNERWLMGASGLSQKVVTDLLAWAGHQMDDYYATMSLTDTGRVIWASSSTVPLWFDIAQDLTERWVHQQHIRDAVGAPGSHARYLPAVLGTFIWAFPHQFQAEAAPGTEAQIDFGAAGAWILSRRAQQWELHEGVAHQPVAILKMSPGLAWRQLTGLSVNLSACEVAGDPDLLTEVLAVRGIIV
jgi:hypothetical protein